jgi:hypothetical protein
MAKTRFFRIAVEGATATDGRTITADMINQSAAGYNAVTYTARINCEHLRGFSPEPPFNAYGSVLSLKAEDFEIEIDGKKQNRRALYGQLDANDQMVATIKADQKIFTSCEFQPDFAKTGKFGLVGLAITDNPASLGTEALKFSAFKPMWDARKLDPTNLFSAAEENQFALETPSAPADPSAGAFASMKAFFDRFTSGHTLPVAPVPPVQTPPVTPTTPPANDNFADIRTGLGLMAASITALGAKVDTDMGAIRSEFGTLKGQLAKTPDPQTTTFRTLSTGGGNGVLTDC